MNFIFNVSILVFVFVSLVGCDTLKTRSDISKMQKQESSVPHALRPELPKAEAKASQGIETPVIAPPSPPQTGSPEPTQPLGLPIPVANASGEKIKVGVVFGPGGVRSFAHIGVIRELVKSKLPIHAVVGIEIGAVAGAIFASKAQMYDVEWQMMKLKEEELFKKSLLGSSKAQDVSELNDFLQKALAGAKIEDTKIAFACPTYNLTKRQTFFISRGQMSSALPMCIPYLPFYEPAGQNIAGLTAVAASAKYLQSKGANYLIFVDLLSGASGSFFDNPTSHENLAWSMVAEANDAQSVTFHKTIKLQLTGFSLTDFSRRRDLIQKGQDAAKPVIKDIQSELGL